VELSTRVDEPYFYAVVHQNNCLLYTLQPLEITHLTSNIVTEPEDTDELPVFVFDVNIEYYIPELEVIDR
jgi:hypothetical protein